MDHRIAPCDTVNRFPRRDWLRILALACLGAAAAQPQWALAQEDKRARIFITTNFDNQHALVAYEPESGKWTSVLENCGDRPRVAPDGKTIAFERDNAIWLAAVDGSVEDRRILDLGGSSGGSPPVWSGDGKRLIVSPAVRDEARDHWKFETFRFDADGANKTALDIPDTDGVHDWSRDGEWVVNVSSRNATMGWTLYLMRPSGKDERRLSVGGNPFGVRFSPDSKKLLYDDSGSDAKRGAWIMGVDGKDAHRVFAIEKGRTGSSCWSPDGKRIAVVTYHVDGSNKGQSAGRLEIMDTDGRNRITYPLVDEKTSRADMPDWR